MDGWNEYYHKEARKYHERVERGSIAPSRTAFDHAMLLEQQAATGALIAAEQALDLSRQQALQAGVVRYGSDQESGFGSDEDDGYNGTMEQQLVQQVDRGWIERWMEGESNSFYFPSDEDGWEGQTEDLWESISAVGCGRERARIDRWQAMCKRIA